MDESSSEDDSSSCSSSFRSSRSPSPKRRRGTNELAAAHVALRMPAAGAGGTSLMLGMSGIVADAPLKLTPGPRAFNWATSGVLQRWDSPEHGAVQYYARVVEPAGMFPGTCGASTLPAAFYFTGLGESASRLESIAKQMSRVAREPFVLVSPVRPKHGWWFINSASKFGWIRGEFDAAMVERHAAWMKSIVCRPGVNAKRVGVFGFSAGAYAVAEILAAGVDFELCGVGLGGVHGHGQWDSSDLPAAHVRSARVKFLAFLRRIRRHQGCRWIEVTHGITDKESKWDDARKIIEALEARQAELRLRRVSARILAPEQQDVTPSRSRNKLHHSYFGAAFVRPMFLQALLGGEPPEPHKVEEVGPSGHVVANKAKKRHDSDGGDLVLLTPQEACLRAAVVVPAQHRAPERDSESNLQGRRKRRYEAVVPTGDTRRVAARSMRTRRLAMP